MKHTVFAAAVSLTLPLLAATPASAVSTEEFVNKAAVSGMFEVQSGELAAEKAEHEDVQDFGEQMVEDHSEANDELKELVKDEDIKVELPTSLDKKHQANLDKLKNVSVAKFDKTYVPMQVLAHEQAVNLFEDYSNSGDNEALKEWAADTLPTLKEHLEDARELNTELSKPAETAAADTEAMDDDAKTTGAADEKATDETAAEDDSKEATPKPSFKYVTRQQPTDWSAEALIGRSVENSEGETLGDINNVVVNEKGQVVAVTIGVGGFLGLGEKDVGVPFDALKFRAEKSMQDETGTDEDTAASDETADTNARFDTEHSDIQIVVNATREQLENAPKYMWLDEQNDKRAENEAVVE